ncbi:Dps family protein [Paenibacillus sp. S-38]|uniref:Dps family protein n=1 Tax=Paenibacillus sp. S-38 TaxID=3416710 RepID=UPI003CE91CEE
MSTMERMQAKEQLNEAVNKQIANWFVLYVKFYNFHWYVKGSQFFTLHTKFEELYTEAGLHIDTLAERLLSLGGRPVAAMSACLELSSVRDAAGSETAEEMVRSTVNDFRTLTGELKVAMRLAEAADDETTGDMLLGIHSSLEKHAWMLEAFLGR